MSNVFKFPKGRTYCLYHGNCADGFAAATVLSLSDMYPFNNHGNPSLDNHLGITYISCIYGKPMPELPTDAVVVMLDFTYKRNVLIDLASKVESILVLDHHKSAKEDLIDLPDNITVIFDMTRSGASLAWDYFIPSDYPKPRLIKHIEDRDLFNFHLPYTEEIQSALFSYSYDFDIWSRMIRKDFFNDGNISDSLAVEGMPILRKQKKDIAEFIAGGVYRSEIYGYDVPTLNVPYMWGSDAGAILCKDEPFAACYWQDGEVRHYSLRSDKTSPQSVDVSKIAVAFGGGGHKHAAGFDYNIVEANKFIYLSTVSVTR